MSTTTLSVILRMGGMVGWEIYDFLGGVFAKQIGSFRSFFWSQLSGLLSIFLLALVFAISVNAPILIIILSAIAAMIYTARYLFFFKGFEIGNVSIVAATMNLWAVFTIFFLYLYETATFHNTNRRRLDDYLWRNPGILKLERYSKSKISTFSRGQGGHLRCFFLWCLLEH